MYDMQKSQSMTGKLTRFIPGGNHAQLVFEVLGDDGKPMMKDGKVVVWGVETGSAANIARNGITVESFPVGTIIGVTLHPLRDGRPFGAVGGPIVHCGDHDARGRLQREDRQSVRRAGELGGSLAEHVPTWSGITALLLLLVASPALAQNDSAVCPRHRTRQPGSGRSPVST